jgi:hypothetical protein
MDSLDQYAISLNRYPSVNRRSKPGAEHGLYTNCSRASRKNQSATARENLLVGLVLSVEIASDPRIGGIRRFLNHAAAKVHEVSFKSRMGVPHADFSQPASGTDPIRQRANEQGLPIGAAGNKRRKSAVLAHVIPVVVEMLSVFLQPRPTHRIDDGQRAVFPAGYRVADVNVVEIKFLVDSHRFLFRPPRSSPPWRARRKDEGRCTIHETAPAAFNV